MINDVGMPEVAGFRANRAHPPGEGARDMGARGGAPNSSPVIYFSLFVVVKGKTLRMIMRGLDQRARHAMTNCGLRKRVATLIYWVVLWSVSLLCARNADRATAFLSCIETGASKRVCGDRVVTMASQHFYNSMRSKTETE